MRCFKLLLLMAVFVLHAVAGAAASVRTCCGGEMDDCTVAQCAAMGCMVEQPPLHTAPAAKALTQAPSIAPVAAVTPSLPAPVQEIWCPPD